MTTKIYGASDDLIEFEGDVRGETGGGEKSEDGRGRLVICSDGTMLDVSYGKNDEAIWEVKLVRAGSLFDRIDQCDDSDADPYSDVAHFKDGLKWVFVANEWEKVK